MFGWGHRVCSTDSPFIWKPHQASDKSNSVAHWKLLVLLVFASSLEVAHLFPPLLVLYLGRPTLFSRSRSALCVQRRVVMEIWDQIEFPSSSPCLTHTDAHKVLCFVRNLFAKSCLFPARDIFRARLVAVSLCEQLFWWQQTHWASDSAPRASINAIKILTDLLDGHQLWSPCV